MDFALTGEVGMGGNDGNRGDEEEKNGMNPVGRGESVPVVSFSIGDTGAGDALRFARRDEKSAAILSKNESGRAVSAPASTGASL